MPRESSQVAAARREYEQCKRLYHKVGKKAAGKPARSQVQRDYAVVKREYHRLGRRLGTLTRKRGR
jgi:Ribonuclease G/E